MLLKLDFKRSVVSSWLTGLFFLVVIISAAFSQFFQAPKMAKKGFSEFQNLLRPSEILGLKKLVITNGLGTYHLEKFDNSQDSDWRIVKPRKLPAKSQIINNFVKLLEQTKIRTVHVRDSINISNYSLDNPSLEIKLLNNEGSETVLNFGLVNPIDNSTFVTLSDQKAIYHIDNIKNSFSKLGLTALIDSRVFPFTTNDISELRIQRFSNKKGKTLFHIKRSTSDWVNPRGKLLNKDRVDKYLNKLFSTKTNSILDSISEEQSEQIENYFNNPSYKVLVKMVNGKEFNFETTYLVQKISGIKIDKNKSFLIRNSNDKGNFIYVLNKDVLSLLYRSEREMKTFEIKKLFY